MWVEEADCSIDLCWDIAMCDSNCSDKHSEEAGVAAEAMAVLNDDAVAVAEAAEPSWAA